MISLRKITKLFLWTRVRVVFTSEDSFHIKPNDQKEKKQIDRVWWKPVPKLRPFSQVSIQALFKIIMFALITKLVIFWNKTRRNIMIKVMETPCLHRLLWHNNVCLWICLTYTFFFFLQLQFFLLHLVNVTSFFSFLSLQGDRGETGPPGPVGFAGPPVSTRHKT